MPPAPIKASTQDHLDIEDIRNDLVILKDGSCCLILQTTAVNFSLLSEGEQDATIYAYAGMLNSLTFPVQILIHSQKKNIQSYLALLNTQEQKIKNPLLKGQLVKYRDFITQTVKENDVLDKKFYIVIPLSKLELGIIPTKEALYQKVRTVLLPRRDQVVRQLNRVGLNATQLQSDKLLQLFYNFYNGTGQEFVSLPQPVKLNAPKPIELPAPPVTPNQPVVADPPSREAGQTSRSHPFVVEELEDNV